MSPGPLVCSAALAALAAGGGCAREAGGAPPPAASETGERASNGGAVIGLLHCGDRHATFVTARGGDAALLELSLGSRVFRLHQVPAASGARYQAAARASANDGAEREGITWLWLEGDAATLVVGGVELPRCAVYDRDRPYRAGGNEPGWQLSIGPTLRFSAPDRRWDAPMVRPQMSTGEWQYVTAVQGRPLTVTLFERRCVDTMSGMPHPTSVEVTFDNEQYRGCGGDPASLLRGAPWVVEAADGAPTPARTTLSFDADGRVTGVGPCNYFNATYTATGEGITVSRPATTRKACARPRMDVEQRFLEVLERTRHFEITGDGALVLRARDGRVIRARRP